MSSETFRTYATVSELSQAIDILIERLKEEPEGTEFTISQCKVKTVNGRIEVSITFGEDN